MKGRERFLESKWKEGAFCSRWERRYLIWAHFESKDLEGRVYAPTSWIRLLWSHLQPQDFLLLSIRRHSRRYRTKLVLFHLTASSANRAYDSAFAGCKTPNSKGPTGTRVAKCRNVQRWLFKCSPGDRSSVWAASTQGWHRDSASARGWGSRGCGPLSRSPARLRSSPLGWLTSSFYFPAFSHSCAQNNASELELSGGPEELGNLEI